jgi:hypothetical protein
MTLATLNLRSVFRCAALVVTLLAIAAKAQLTPSADSYTNTASSNTNYGSSKLLDVETTQTTFIQFDLSSIPSGYTGANVTKASLKLYVNTVTKAGSFNVDYVNGSWAENTIDAGNAPALGTTIAASVPLVTADKNQYILIDITSAVQAWLNGTPNDGIALVANSPLNATFDSKESTTTSHPAELDIVFAGSGGGITGINTASGSGLTGGGTSGTLNLSLITSCSSGQILEWSGSAWACTNLSGGGTITGVTAGTDLTGGGKTGNVTLNLDITKVPQLATANTFTGDQTVNGNLSATETVTASNLNAANASLSNVLSINSAGNNPLFVATSSSTSATAIYGAASSTTGTAFGVEGVTASSGTAYGVVGYAVATTGSPYGVYGLTNSLTGVGVFGQNGSLSEVATLFTGSSGVGTWGDAGADGTIAVLGTVDNGQAGLFENNSAGEFALSAENRNASGFPFVALSGVYPAYCNVDNSGNLNCTGAKHAVVPIDGGKRIVAMSAIESPQNWFEDVGESQLVNGSATVALDPDFIQTVNAETNYKVFPVPNGDCKGLYVTNKTAKSFEVRELGGGTSSIRFDYRIMALRKNYENVRFEDHTHDPDPRRMMRRMKSAPELARTADKKQPR